LTLFRVKRRTGWTVALAFVVLLAQFGAQAHAYSHLASAPDNAQHHAHAVPCAECSTFAPLLAAVSNSSYAVPPPALNHEGVSALLTVAVTHAAVCQAYRSRAPPTQF
jgi:hypothetical protein